MDTLGVIQAIEEVNNFELGNVSPKDGSKGAQLGMVGMLNYLGGGRSMDGYRVKTSEHEFVVLIDNGQSCCENWGYLSTDDDPKARIGATLLSVELADTRLTAEPLEDLVYIDEGGVQFVTFKTDGGDFQLAVYNGHNGYYGHGIIVAKDNEILCQDTL